MKNKRDIKSDLLIAFGVFLILLGIFMLIYIHYTSKNRQKDIKTNKEKFEEMTKKKFTEANEKENETSDKKEVKEDKKEEDKLKMLDGIIGYIEIKQIDLTLPIYPKIDEEILMKGVGIMEEYDSLEGEKGKLSVLAGHRGTRQGDAIFKHIDRLKKGDLITILTSKGKDKYRVTGSEIISDDDWSKFTREEDKAKLILMSCNNYPVFDERLLVYLEKDK